MYPDGNTTHWYECPDCAGTWNGQGFTHDATCPASAALEWVCDADRRFFEDHPGTSRYYRPISRIEFEEMQAAGEIPDGVAVDQVKMRVDHLAQGIRVRSAVVAAPR